MKKRGIILIFLLSFLFIDIDPVKCNVGISSFSLEINKQNFYPDEILKINGSWEIYYEQEDKCYLQYRIYNNSDYEEMYLVWKSDRYNETGQFNKKLNLSLDSILPIDWSITESIDLYVTLYYHLIDYPDTITKYLANESLKVTIRPSFQFENLELNKNIFYPNESVQIESKWNLDYYEQEVCFTQLQIFNDSMFTNQTLLWKSEQFNERGVITKALDLPIEDLIDVDLLFPGSIDLNVALSYRLVNHSRFITGYYGNKTFKVISRGSFKIQDLQFNKKMLYSNETLKIDALWNLDYFEPEISYIQFNIYNSTIFNNQTFLWKSDKFKETGNKKLIIRIPITEIINASLKKPLNLTIKLDYFHMDLNCIQHNETISNFVITIIPLSSSNSEIPSNNQIMNILIPSGLGTGVLAFALVIYFTKRGTEKEKNIEDLVIEL